jgi:methylenetetrahydrofolate reductase (NADPH)
MTRLSVVADACGAVEDFRHDDAVDRGTRMTLSQALASGRFVLTAEFGPPRDPDPAPVRAAARLLGRLVDAVNVTDNQAATVKVSALAVAALLAAEGVDPILQLTARDRNLMALQAELLGAWTLGVRTVLALRGDPLHVGLYASLATHVGDVDAVALIELIRDLNDGHLAAGEELKTPTNFLIAGAANPLLDSVERLERKLDAGVSLLQSNVVYDIDRFIHWFAPIAEAGIVERAPLLVGVMPPRSTRMLRHMHDNIPGVEVPDAVFARMDGLQDQAAKDEGTRIAAELIDALRNIEGVSGAHVMAPGWETEAVPRIVESLHASIGPARMAGD